MSNFAEVQGFYHCFASYSSQNMCFQSAATRGNGRCILWPLTSAVNSLNISICGSKEMKDGENEKIIVYYTKKMAIS